MIRYFVAGAIVAGVCVPGSEAGGFLENLLAPVLVDSRVSDIHRRSPERVCFTWSYEKRRAPPQLFFTWFAVGSEDKDRSMIPLTVVSDGPERPLRTGKARASHLHGDVKLCADLHDYLADDAQIMIHGFVVYQGANWRLVYRIGPVDVRR